MLNEEFAPRRARIRVEVPTLMLAVATYAAGAALTVLALDLGPWLSVPLLAVVLAQHSSLQHEAIHGHPFRAQWMNDALVFPAVGVLVPYERFRELHLEHHHDPLLTDPYDDPESNYLDPAVWARLSRPWRALLRFNNTLLGRMLVGPAIGLRSFWGADLQAILAGDRRAALGWALHLAALVPVALWLGFVAEMPVWQYLLACYLALSLLKIRTFLEHRAHERCAARSVIIEDRGPLSILFLNNNFHAVHHAHPGIAWYDLPGEFARRREEFLRRNDGYVYPSYWEVFRRHFLARKDEVAHPLLPLPGTKPARHPVSGRSLHP